MKPLGQINVIPFIDIMLVLLAVVLTTATFVAQGRIPIALPEASQVRALQESTQLELTIDARGGVYLQDRQLDLGVLQTELLEITDKSIPVRLHVDARAEFTHFVAVIDLLKANELENLSIITRRAGG